MGTSSDAWLANRMLTHVVALVSLLRQRNPWLRITFENPKATVAGHPLMRDLWVAPPPHGFGEFREEVAYCNFGVSEKKPTLVYHNIRHLHSDLTRPDGTPKYECSAKGCPCQFWRNHKRGVRGEASIRDTAIYPPDFCIAKVRPAHAELRHLTSEEGRFVDHGFGYGYGPLDDEGENESARVLSCRRYGLTVCCALGDCIHRKDGVGADVPELDVFCCGRVHDLPAGRCPTSWHRCESRVEFAAYPVELSPPLACCSTCLAKLGSKAPEGDDEWLCPTCECLATPTLPPSCELCAP